MTSMERAASIRSGIIRRSFSLSFSRSEVRRTVVYCASFRPMGESDSSEDEALTFDGSGLQASMLVDRTAVRVPAIQGAWRRCIRLPSFELTLTRYVSRGPAGPRMRFCLVVPLALEPDEGDELLVFLLRESVRNGGNQPFDQRDPLFELQGVGLIHQGPDSGMVHPIGLFAGGHSDATPECEGGYSLETAERAASSSAWSRSA